MRLLVMSLGGALMICVIFLVRLLLQNRTHRGVWLLLWGLVLVRLLVPIVPNAPSSIFNLPMFRQPTAPVPETVQVPVQTIPAETVTAAPAAAPTLSAAGILTIIWLAAAVGVFLYFVISHLRARRQYRFAIPVTVADIPARVRVKELEGLTSPLTYGLLHPVILLPAGTTEHPDDCCRVLAHELAHIRHGDVLFKWLLLLAASVHWFNPLAWVMMDTASQDLEMRADASAVKALGETENYARMLIRAEEQKLVGYAVSGFSVSNTALRLRAMVKGRASRALSVCTAVLLAAVLLAVCCTGQMPQAEQPAPAPISEQTETALPTEETDAPVLTEAPSEVLPVETEPVPTEAPTEASTEPAPTEAPAPTEPAPTEAPVPTEPVPGIEPKPAPYPLTEPDEPDSQALPTPAPTNQLPTSYSVPSPGSITLRVGQTASYTLQSKMNLAFFSTGALEVSAYSYGIPGDFNEVSCYSVSLTGWEVGTYSVYCKNENGVTLLWATVTVLP